MIRKCCKCKRIYGRKKPYKDKEIMVNKLCPNCNQPMGYFYYDPDCIGDGDYWICEHCGYQEEIWRKYESNNQSPKEI